MRGLTQLQNLQYLPTVREFLPLTICASVSVL